MRNALERKLHEKTAQLLAGSRVFNREVESRLNPQICPARLQGFEGLEINDSDRDFSREVESRLNRCFLSAGCPKVVELVF